MGGGGGGRDTGSVEEIHTSYSPLQMLGQSGRVLQRNLVQTQNKKETYIHCVADLAANNAL